MGEQGGQPERRIGRILKSKVLGRRRVTLVVELSRLRGKTNIRVNTGLASVPTLLSVVVGFLL